MTKPICPRCGYEQSGTVQTWRESCPLTGTCSECGLGFCWADVLNPGRVDLAGFVEQARGGWWQVLAAAWRTWVWSMLPWVFWRKVRLDHRVVPRRWAAWAILTLVLVHVGGALVGTLCDVGERAIKIADHERALAAKLAPNPLKSRFTTGHFKPFTIAPAAPSMWSTVFLAKVLNRWTAPAEFFESGFESTKVLGMQTGLASMSQSKGSCWVYASQPKNAVAVARPCLRFSLQRPTLFVAVGWHVGFGLGLMMLRKSRLLVRVRAAQVSRAIVYGLGWVVGVRMVALLQSSTFAVLDLVCAWQRVRSLYPMPALEEFARVVHRVERVFSWGVVPALALSWWPLAIWMGWRCGRRGWVLLLAAGVPAALTATCAAAAWNLLRLGVLL